MGQVVQMMDLEGATYTHRDMNQQTTQVTRVHQDVRNEENGLEEISRNETGQESVSYTYSIWGNQTELIYIDGTSVINTYDALDRLISVTDSTGTSQISYFTDEHQIIETRNRWTKTRTYELDQVISYLETTLNEEDEEVLLFSQVLSYDETGQVIREERTQNSVLTVIENEYNLRGELRQSTQTCGNSKVTYLYTTTPWGNKSETIIREVNGEVSIESKTFTYNHLNQMEHVIQDTVETTFTYDARGNLIEERIGSQVIKTYTYDVSNRLIKVQDASETQKYTYDGDGNRLTKTIQDTLTEDISHQVYYVNDTSVENERVIQVQDNTENRNVVYGLERIHEAGVLYLSDSYGNIIQHGTKTYAYTPYGELIGGTITGVNEAGYKGEVHDIESLQYLRARTYHTKYQVFLSEDTVVGCDTHPLSQNRYTFALNNPYKYSDPSGNVPQSFDDGNKQANVPGSRQRTIQDEQAFQEAEVKLINRYVKPVKGNDYKPDEPITDNSPFYDDLGALQRALNQKTQDSINASKKIASEDSLNPYNYQPSVSTKQSGDVRRFSESNPLNDPNTKTFLKGVSNLIFGGALFVTGMSIFLSGGLTLIPIIMATGGVLYGSSKFQEGIHQVLLGANGKGEEKSFYYLRDTVFQGNQAVYDAVGMFSTFGPALPSIVKAIPQLAAPVLGALGLKQVVYEATGSEEVANLATDVMMLGPVLQQVNKAINPGQMDDIIIQTSDEALNFVDDVLDDGLKITVDDILDDGVKNTVDNIVDDTASQVSSEASALEGGVNKIVNSADDVVFKQSSIDKAFTKHSADFGKYADGSKASLQQFQNDVSNLINNGIQKSGTWKGVEGTHIYNATTKQWAFVNADGTFNTAFKLSDNQFKYLLESGVVK